MLAADVPSLPPVEAPAPASGGKHFQWVWGGSFKEDGYSLNTSVTAALGHNLATSGWLVRVGAAFGQYDYGTSSVPGGIVDVDSYRVDALIGYQFVADTMKYTLFVGADYQDRQQDPVDPNSLTGGSVTGFKVQGDMRTRGETPFFFSLAGYYTTAHDTYYAQARVGADILGLTIGPEAAVFGNVASESQRVGLFVSGIRLGPVNTTVSGGYAFGGGSDDDGADGAYGGFSSTLQF